MATSIGKISNDLRAYGDYLLNGVTVPQNTTTTGSACLVGGARAQLELVAIVNSTISLADTKVLTVNLTASATEGGSFTALTTLYTKTASGATTLAAGTELGRYVVKPSDLLWAKGVLVTTDSAATGKIDLYVRKIAS